jgi:hypothetical protein
MGIVSIFLPGGGGLGKALDDEIEHLLAHNPDRSLILDTA